MNNTANSNRIFGFWIYILSDCVLFSTLFVVYIIFRTHTFGNFSGKDLFEIKFVFIETMLLLVSSFTFGMSMIASKLKKKSKVIKWLWFTAVLGILFVGMEFYEFQKLFNRGIYWIDSAFLSSFFALVGTHGLHVVSGIIWIISLIYQIEKYGLNDLNECKIIYLGLFWHFLDIIWIFVFSIVYLMGVI